jgi:hypothetical protein
MVNGVTGFAASGVVETISKALRTNANFLNT